MKTRTFRNINVCEKTLNDIIMIITRFLFTMLDVKRILMCLTWEVMA